MRPQNIAMAVMSLPEADLQTLLGCSRTPELSGTSPPLASWLRRLLHTEMHRRDGFDVSFPRPGLDGWSDQEIGDALGAAVILEGSTVSEAADHFARQILVLLTLHAAGRLTIRSMAACN